MKLRRPILFLLLSFSLLASQGDLALVGDVRQYDTRAIDAYMQGMAQEAAGEYEDALESFHQAAAIDSGSVDIYFSMARLLLQMGRVEEGRNALQRIIRLDSGNLEALELLGEIARGEEDWATALSIFQRILDRDPRNEYALLQLADSYRTLGDSLREAGYLVRLWEANSDRVRALRRAEMIFLNAKKYDRLIDLYDRLIKRMPENSELVQRQIRLFLGMNRFFDAEALMDSLLSVVPGSVEYHAMKTDLVKAMHGEMAAIEYLDKSVEELPESWELRMKLAQLLIDAGESLNAQRLIRELLEIHPDKADAVSMLVWTYLDLDAPDSAAQILRDYLPAFPGNLALHRMLGSILYDLATTREDTALYREAIMIERQTLLLKPDDQQTLHLLANSLDNLGQTTEVLEVYQHLLQVYPDDDLAMNNYAYMLAENSEEETVLRQAADLSQRALALNPQSAPYLDTAGWIYYKLGHVQLAKDFIQRSLEIDPDNVEVLRHMGAILEYLGKTNEAYVYYLRAENLE